MTETTTRTFAEGGYTSTKEVLRPTGCVIRAPKHDDTFEEGIDYDFVVQQARYLNTDYLGWEISLPGDWAKNEGKGFRWVDTWSALIRVEHTLGGVVVRRDHTGDKMGQHTLEPDSTHLLRKRKDTQ